VFAILLLLGVGFFGVIASPEVAVQEPVEVGVAPVMYVQFKIEAPGAASVELAGSFTEWTSGVQLVETAPGVWSALVALEPGVYDYGFVVDGELWMVDPTAPEVDDGFGGTNSRLFLTPPGGNA
jgi:1,4-alpha-glucan branching enzyme